jgi:hypothetical protein
MSPAPRVPMGPPAQRRAAACLVVGILIASSAVATASERIELGAGISTWYDSNPIQYSDTQRALFNAGLNPERFSIHSTDDVLWRPSISLTWIRAGDRGRARTVGLRGTGSFHSQDGTADFRSASATWRESFSSRSRLSLGGYYLPHYYLRQLFDEDVVTAGVSKYRRAEFDLGIGSMAWRQRLSRRSRIEARYQFERRTYVHDFQERSSSTHQGEMAMEWVRLPRSGSLEVRAGYRTSLAKAEDGDDAALAIPDDADVGYRGFVGGLGGDRELGRGRRWRLRGDLGYELETRHYTSSRLSDVSHHGRDDTNHAVEAGLRWSTRRGWSLRGFYRFEQNTANLAVPVSTVDLGSYTEHRLGLSVDRSITVWKRSPGVEDEEPGESSP